MDAVQKTAKRSQARGETRARLVQIGTEVLSEKGFSSTGLEEILDKAGVPKGSFYYYFENKASFGFAVIDNYDYLWAQKLTRLLRDPTVAPLKRIDNYICEGIRGLEKYAFRRGCLIGNMGQEVPALEEEFRDRILKVFVAWAEQLSVCLREAREAGQLRDDINLDDVAKFFWFSWEGAILQAKLERSVKPIERFRSIMFEAVLTKGC